MKNINPILGAGGLHHAAIKAKNWSETLQFYEDTLGFKTKVAWGKAPARAAYLDAGDGSFVEVFEDPAYSSVPNGAVVHFCLRTDRLDAVCERARASGARITMEPRSAELNSTNGAGVVPIRLCFFEGPNGESIELLQSAI
jgi:catechol 2,3-dioxygenase-like lactoylglutathione lyase family enzyme